MFVRLRRLLCAGLLGLIISSVVLPASPALGQAPAPRAYPEYVNTSGRALPILEGSSGQPVRFGDEPWVIKPGERFFSLPWGDAPRFRWGDKSFHYLGAIGGSRFRFFLVEDWGPAEPARVVAPTRASAAPKYEISNQWGRPVPVIDGVSGRPVFFGKDPWLIPAGDSVLSHPWTDNTRFVLNGRPYHFIGTAGSTSFFNFFVVPDNNYDETGCTNDWTITFYGVSDEKFFDGPRVPVFAAEKPAEPLGELPVALLNDTILQGTGLARSFKDGRPRHFVVQKLTYKEGNVVASAQIRIVDRPIGRFGPVLPWSSAAGPADLAYRWQYSGEGPFTQVTIQSLGPSSLPPDVADRVLNKPLAITDTGGSARLAPTRHHLDIFVGTLDRDDPVIATLLKAGTVKQATVCVKWP